MILICGRQPEREEGSGEAEGRRREEEQPKAAACQGRVALADQRKAGEGQDALCRLFPDEGCYIWPQKGGGGQARVQGNLQVRSEVSACKSRVALVDQSETAEPEDEVVNTTPDQRAHV